MTYEERLPKTVKDCQKQWRSNGGWENTYRRHLWLQIWDRVGRFLLAGTPWRKNQWFLISNSGNRVCGLAVGAASDTQVTQGHGHGHKAAIWGWGGLSMGRWAGVRGIEEEGGSRANEENHRPAFFTGSNVLVRQSQRRAWIGESLWLWSSAVWVEAKRNHCHSPVNKVTMNPGAICSPKILPGTSSACTPCKMLIWEVSPVSKKDQHTR